MFNIIKSLKLKGSNHSMGMRYLVMQLSINFFDFVDWFSRVRVKGGLLAVH